MIDHGQAATKLQIQRQLPNGQWNSCGQTYEVGASNAEDRPDAMNEHLADLKKRYPMWKIRVRVERIFYIENELLDEAFA